MTKYMFRKLSFLLFWMLLIPSFMACENNRIVKASGEANDAEVDTIQTDTISILVTGDLMQHGPQLNAAFNGKSYDYKACFELVSEEVKKADLAIANFEVTLGGKPYKGYPCFSAPDEYLNDIIDAGFDILTTGNNHCLDSGKRGLERTIDMMDSIHVPHLGTYKDREERNKNYPLIVEKNNFKIALLNFTYATNGLRVKEPNVVNYIDTVEIAADILKAKAMHPDIIIAIPHWGIEYSLTPAKADKDLANWLFRKGVDHIIGGHPHVVQPMECRNPGSASGGNILVYSLGNYISNQSKPNTYGGAMVKMVFSKTDGKVRLDDYGYMLTYCSRPQVSGRRNYRIIPVERDDMMNATDKSLCDQYVKNMDNLFSKHNVDFGRFPYRASQKRDTLQIQPDTTKISQNKD